MNKLPIEIVSSIIQHIDEQSNLLTCSLVNRCFYIATLPYLWRFFAQGKHMDGEDLPINFINCLSQNPPHPIKIYVKELELHSKWTDTELLRLMTLIGTQLEDVYIAQGEKISNTSFQQIPHYWPHLTALYSRYHTASQESMIAIARHCPRLRLLHLGYCQQLSPHTFSPFIEAGRHLQKISLHSGSGPESWNYQTVLDLAQLPLTNFWFDGSPEIMHDMLTSITQAWPTLTHLRLDDIGEVGDDRRLIPFIKTHPRLTHLSLEGTVMTNATLEAIATYLPAIVDINLNQNKNITARGIYRLVRDCFYLEQVGLTYCGLKASELQEACLMDNDPDVVDDIIFDPDLSVSHLDQVGIDSIRRIGYQGIRDEDQNNNDDDDDDDKAWMHTWQRSFINLRLYGSGVA